MKRLNMEVLLKFAVAIFLITLVTNDVDCDPVSDSNGTAWTDLNAQMLVKLGRKLNRPILTLIGMSLRNLHPCSEWTQWSPCVAKHGYFGTKSRQRNCEKTLLTDTSKYRLAENDTGLCEGFCPEDYIISENGFCMKLFKTEMNQDASKAQCQKDGAHLINIDSDVKHKDAQGLLEGVNKYIFINGRRKDVNAAWEFSYGSQEKHIEWASGQPDDVSLSLCLVLDASHTRLLHDLGCNANKYFLCEITN